MMCIGPSGHCCLNSEQVSAVSQHYIAWSDISISVTVEGFSGIYFCETILVENSCWLVTLQCVIPICVTSLEDLPPIRNTPQPAWHSVSIENEILIYSLKKNRIIFIEEYFSTVSRVAVFAGVI